MRRKKKREAAHAVLVVKRPATVAEQSRINITFERLIDALLRQYLGATAGPERVPEQMTQQRGEVHHEH